MLDLEDEDDCVDHADQKGDKDEDVADLVAFVCAEPAQIPQLAIADTKYAEQVQRPRDGDPHIAGPGNKIARQAALLTINEHSIVTHL